jgi:hypothetical protein
VQNAEEAGGIESDPNIQPRASTTDVKENCCKVPAAENKFINFICCSSSDNFRKIQTISVVTHPNPVAHFDGLVYLRIQNRTLSSIFGG